MPPGKQEKEERHGSTERHSVLVVFVAPLALLCAGPPDWPEPASRGLNPALLMGWGEAHDLNWSQSVALLSHHP